jgi:putative sterol carrier protein
VTTAQEVFDRMPGAVQAGQAQNVNAVFQFDLSGEGGGTWHATLAGGELKVTEGAAPSPHVTLSASAADYVAIANGELNPMNAFMQGRIRVKGDLSLVMRMQGIFGR